MLQPPPASSADNHGNRATALWVVAAAAFSAFIATAVLHNRELRAQRDSWAAANERHVNTVFGRGEELRQLSGAARDDVEAHLAKLGLTSQPGVRGSRLYYDPSTDATYHVSFADDGQFQGGWNVRFSQLPPPQDAPWQAFQVIRILAAIALPGSWFSLLLCAWLWRDQTPRDHYRGALVLLTCSAATTIVWFLTPRMGSPDRLNTYWFVGLPMIAVSLGMWIHAARRLRSHRRSYVPTCARCGYNLTGNVSGVCPECGTSQRRTGAAVRPALYSRP